MGIGWLLGYLVDCAPRRGLVQSANIYYYLIHYISLILYNIFRHLSSVLRVKKKNFLGFLLLFYLYFFLFLSSYKKASLYIASVIKYSYKEASL